MEDLLINERIQTPDELKKIRETICASAEYNKEKIFVCAGGGCIASGSMKVKDALISELQKKGFRAVKHQSFVGTGYFDEIQTVVTSGKSATVAMKDSTETAQFH